MPGANRAQEARWFGVANVIIAEIDLGDDHVRGDPADAGTHRGGPPPGRKGRLGGDLVLKLADVGFDLVDPAPRRRVSPQASASSSLATGDQRSPAGAARVW